MPTDNTLISKAFRLWYQPGDVFEIRVLEAISADWHRPHMESGYFDYDHIDEAATAIARLHSYRGAYATVNPVNPDLLARSCNRLQAITRQPTTADGDITTRRWLLIDCDPKRVSGVSSSEDEHAASVAVAKKIRDGLTQCGWSAPIFIDSGNGTQMMYRIDLPADDGGLVQRCIAGIATAGDDQVDVDLTVYNPARIWRIPGTMNCKGDDTTSRPHRMATLLEVPQEIVPITVEQLEVAASWQSAGSVTPPSAPMDEDGFVIDQWIAKYCPELGAPREWKGGRKWVFPVCPFNDAHRNSSAVLIQQPNGAIAFTCHHNGCVGNDWHKLREMREPGCYDWPQGEIPGIDISGIVNQKSKEPVLAEAEKQLYPNPGPIPDRLLHIPGFVEDIVQLDMNSAPYPNRVLSFAGALSLLAFLCGRKFQDKRDNRTNIYFVALADSGTGKDHPRKINFRIAFDAGIAHAIGDAFASGEGLEDAMFICPSMLFQVDELDCIFNTMKYGKDGRSESINEKLLKFYSAANTIYPLRKKAIMKKKNGEEQTIAHIVNPNLVIFGTAIPQYFYESLSRRALENGLVARCIIMEAGQRGKHGEPHPIAPTESILRAAKYLVDYNPSGNLVGEYPRPFIIPEKPDATKLMKEIQDKCDEFYSFFEKEHASAAMALWARAYEKVCKLAMLYALSENVFNPAITKNAVKWAWDFVEHQTKRMLFMAHSYVYENVFDEKCQKVIRKIREAGGKIAHSKLLHQIHESAETLKKVIDTLTEQKTVVVEYSSGNGKVSKSYRLAETAGFAENIGNRL